MDKDWKD